MSDTESTEKLAIEIDVRKEVKEFAQRMESVLQDNDYKEGWDQCHPLWLVSKLMEEVGEVADLISEIYLPDGNLDKRIFLTTNSRVDQLMWECVDVANVAMMIRDRVSSRPVLGTNHDRD